MPKVTKASLPRVALSLCPPCVPPRADAASEHFERRLVFFGAAGLVTWMSSIMIKERNCKSSKVTLRDT